MLVHLSDMQTDGVAEAEPTPALAPCRRPFDLGSESSGLLGSYLASDRPVQQARQVQDLGLVYEHQSSQPTEGVAAMGFVAWLTTNAAFVRLRTLLTHRVFSATPSGTRDWFCA